MFLNSHQNDKAQELNKIVALYIKEKVNATPLFIAAAIGRVDLLDFCVRRGDDYISPMQDGLLKGTTPFFIACNNGHLQVVQYFVGVLKIDFISPMTMGDVKGTCPLEAAIKLGHRDVVHYLNEAMTQLKTQCMNTKK